PAHDGIGLAGLHRFRRLRAHHERRDRLCGRASGPRTGRRAGRQRAALLESENGRRCWGSGVIVRRSLRFLLVIATTISALHCSRPNQPGTLTIAVIPKGTTHVFWQSIHAGAAKAAKELGVSIIWRGPLREDERDSQVSDVEGYVSRGLAGVVLAPLDEAALAPPVADAKRAWPAVVALGSGLEGSDFVGGGP